MNVTMKELARASLKAAIPNYIGTMAMLVCAFYMKRHSDQMDRVAEQVIHNTTNIAVHDETIHKMTTAFGNVDQICRVLESRVIKLETQVENSNKGKL